MVPEGWVQSTVGHCCNIQNNLRLPISSEERKKIHGKYPYFGPTGILDHINEYRICGEFALIGEDGDHFLKHKEKDMTLLFSGKANVNNHAHIITDSDKCLAKWFHLYFIHRDITSHLTRQGAKRYKLTKAGLENLPIVLPPPPEQEKIFNVVISWDRAVTVAEQLLTNSQQQKKALMQQLLSGKQRLPGFSGAWQTVRFGEAFRERVETGLIELPLLSITSEEGVIDREETGRKDTSNADKSKYLRICPGDIGYNTMRMWQGVSGLSALEGLVSPAYTVLTPQPGIDPLFAAYLFKLPALVHVFYRHSQGLVSDTWNLKYANFAKIKWSIPGVDEQKAIAAVLYSADREIETLQKQLAGLKQEKKALMQQLLTGKRRVKIDET